MVKGSLVAKRIPVIVHSTTGYFGQFGFFGVSSYLPIEGGYTVYVPQQYREDAAHEAETVLGDLWEKVKLTDWDLESF